MSDTEYNEVFPRVLIPTELESSSSDSEIELTESNFSSEASIPSSQVGADTTSVTLSDSSDSRPLPCPIRKPRRKKIHPGRFAKGHKRRAIFVTPSKPKSKRAPLPRSELLNGIRLPTVPSPYMVMLKQGEKVQTKQLLVPLGSQVMNMEILAHVFYLMRCQQPGCTGHMRIHKFPYTDGLKSYFVVHCGRCHEVVAQFSNSPHLGEKPIEAVNNPLMFKPRRSEVNTRSLIAVHTTSLSWQDFRLTCALLDLPIPARSMSKHALERLVDLSNKVSEDAMSLAADEVRNRVDVEPSNIDGSFRCHVSYDGSWHRRGHYSNQGFGAVIDSESGKVLDYDLLQRICRKCLTWTEERKKSQPEEFEAFKADHESECTANFSGSSQEMEGTIALNLWKRSISRNQLVYSTYIGDGDSSSFKAVIESDPYGGKENIRKEECIGHVQKRLKNHLIVSSATSPAIAKAKVEKFGQLYRLAVLQNRGKSPEVVQRALWTVLDHLASKHDNCPSNTSSWCYFAKAQAERSSDPSVPAPKLRKPFLSGPETSRVREVFKTFASLAFCGSIAMGKTQNSNESLHSVVWHNSPKGKYVGQKSIICSTAMAVSLFNEGSLSLAALLYEYGISPSYATLYHLAERDRIRNSTRKRAVLYSKKRRERQVAVAASTSKKKYLKSAMYDSGKFGTECEMPSSEDYRMEDSSMICSICDENDCPIGSLGKIDNWIGCDICEQWFHGKCVGIKNVSAYNDTPYFCDDCQYL